MTRNDFDEDTAREAIDDSEDCGDECRGCTGTCCTGVGSEPCTC